MPSKRIKRGSKTLSPRKIKRSGDFSGQTAMSCSSVTGPVGRAENVQAIFVQCGEKMRGASEINSSLSVNTSAWVNPHACNVLSDRSSSEMPHSFKDPASWPAMTRHSIFRSATPQDLSRARSLRFSSACARIAGVSTSCHQAGPISIVRTLPSEAISRTPSARLQSLPRLRDCARRR